MTKQTQKQKVIEGVLRQFKKKYKDYLECAYEEIPDRNLGDEMVSDLKTSLQKVWNEGVEEKEKENQKAVNILTSLKVIETPYVPEGCVLIAKGQLEKPKHKKTAQIISKKLKK